MENKNYYCPDCHTYFNEPEERDYDDVHYLDAYADPWAKGTTILVCPECGSEDFNEV